MTEWHQSDRFWETWAPYLFSESRLAAAPAEVAQTIKLLRISPPDSVLDLCCGPGRHAIEMARHGFRITGIDRTHAYLLSAAAAARAERVEINFVEADARSYQTRAVFKAVINMFSSFGYYEDPADDLLMAANACTALLRGGRFLIDIEGKEIVGRDFREREWYRHSDGTLGLQERRISNGWERLERRWILIRDGRIISDSVVTQRLYSATELKRLLAQAGFGAVDIYGSLAGTPYNHEAQRLVAVATR
jgi:SAM-dependent methyltransferase